MTWLSDAVLAHLRDVADQPDVTGTRYELAERIGRGGMGAVYRAHDRVLDRPVAVKVLHAVARDAAAEARFRTEARIIARLEHPGIVPVHDAGVLPDGRFYYAMKLVRGKRLDEQFGPSTPLAERLRTYQKICEAVAFAHAHGVIHRDLKPDNVMLGPFGEVLVLDWGVAREAGTAPVPPADRAGAGPPCSSRTAHGTVLGTPGYMAPEQASGDVDQTDERTDVYGLGGILYFLLSGRPPERVDGVGGAGVAGCPPVTPPRHHDRRIPRPLEAVCLKALAAERSERYAAVADLAADVAAYLAGTRVRAYRENVLASAGRLVAKYHTVLALILAYVVMRILLLLFAGA